MFSKSKKMRFIFTILLLSIFILLCSHGSTFAQTHKYILKLSAPKIFLNGGNESAVITAKVMNLKKKPVSGIEVSFFLYSGEGSLSQESSTTDSEGKAITNLINATSKYVYIRADIDGAKLLGKRIVRIKIRKASFSTTFNLTLSAEPTIISSNGNTSTIKALLRNNLNNPIGGAVITFEANHGKITATGVTNSEGIATATLSSETSDGFNGNVTVTARYNNLPPATVTVKFVVAGVKLSLALSTNTIANDGTTAIITAILTDSSNNPVVGKTVSFSNALDIDGDGTISAGDTLDYATLSATSGTTDSDGKVTGITVSSVNTGSVVIEATVDNIVADELLKIVIPTEVKSVTVSSDNSKIMINGGTTLISANFKNITSGKATFTTTLGYFTNSEVIPIDVEVDSSGNASAILTAGNKTGIAEVSVSILVDPITGERVEGSTFIKISSAAAAKIELSASPDNIPINTGVSTITAMVKDANNNPVAGTLVGFKIVNSPGGTGPDNTSQLSAASAVTDADGIATVTFFAGALETQTFKGVRIDAFLTNDTSVEDTTYLTISGKPSFISITFAEAPIINDDSSLTLPITALISDIHGNPVADGTPVSLGLVITRLAKVGNLANDTGNFSGSQILNTEDLNQNGVLDLGEDINNNGVLDFIEDVNGNGILDPGEDLNGNGVLDRSKTLEQVGALVTPGNATTDNGVAKAKLMYGQSLMERYQVLISAEAGGIVNSQYLVLPHTLREILIDGAVDKTKFVPTDQIAFIVSDTTGKDILPAGPTELKATLISAGGILLEWTDNSNKETGFEIERSTASGSGFVQIADETFLGVNATNYIDSTAAIGTIYFYRVRAVNLSGKSNYSNEASNSKPFILPPNGLTVSVSTTNEITLSWTDNSSNETGFSIERKASVGIGDFEVVGIVSAGTTVFRDNTVVPSTTKTYIYRVQAFSEDKTSLYSNEASVTLNLIFKPTGFTATKTSSTTIDLSWTDNSDNETGFSIERKSTLAGPFKEIGIVSAGVTSFTDVLPLPKSTTGFLYRVRAFNVSGASDYSDEAGAELP